MFVVKPLLMAVSGDAADLVNLANCGLTISSENPQQLADAVDALAAMPLNDLKIMGENAASFYRENLSMAVGVSKFKAVFDRINHKERVSER